MNLMILIIIVIQNEINLHHQKNVNTLFFYFIVDLEVNFHLTGLIRYLSLFIKVLYCWTGLLFFLNIQKIYIIKQLFDYF